MVSVSGNNAGSNTFAPLIHNGVLIFTGTSGFTDNITPTTEVKISQVLIYEGRIGVTSVDASFEFIETNTISAQQIIGGDASFQFIELSGDRIFLSNTNISLI